MNKTPQEVLDNPLVLSNLAQIFKVSTDMLYVRLKILINEDKNKQENTNSNENNYIKKRK